MNKKLLKSQLNDRYMWIADSYAGIISVSAKCNLNCFFCEKGAPEGVFAGETREAVFMRLRELSESVDAVVFTGGEPTINRNLVSYIMESARLGFKHICLETNGLMFSYPEYSRKILSSGLTRIVFMQISYDPVVSDAVAQLPGGWELTRKGIASTEGGGAEVAVCIPLLKETIEGLDRHVLFIARNFPHVKSVVLQPVRPSPGGDEGVSIGDLELVLPRAMDAAGGERIELRFSHGDAPAPCLFKSPDRFVSLFVFPPVMKNSGARLLAAGACEDCFMRGHCGGIHPRFYSPEDIAAAPTAEFAGAALKQWASRDKRISRLAGEENEIGFSAAVINGGKTFVEEVLLRINYNCNQRCLFCWVEEDFVSPAASKVEAYIEKLRQYEIGTVCVTGGEPTLNGNLIEYVEALKTPNIRKVCLQTNAVLLSKNERAERLARAGVDFALVSLHSHKSEVSDITTGLAGSFDKTVKGISNLRKNGVTVLVSHVINSFNYSALPEFVRFSASALDRSPIVFSAAAPIYGAMMGRGMIPKLGDLKEHLMRAVDLCYELRVPFSGLTAMCGVPLCVFGGRHECYPDARLIAPQPDNRDMIKIAACGECGLTNYCFGIRKNYADFYGTDELHPVSAEGFKPYEMDVWNTDFLHVYFSKVFGV